MDRFHRFYEPAKARPATGGIKSQSKRGSFGQSWWARRWIEVLESFDIGARLTRGKSYARRGQVLSIYIDKGLISAEVQGSRSRPYLVSISVKTLSAAQWKKVSKELSNQVIFAAQLLNGEMSPDIEGVFAGAGLSLFPEKRTDLKTKCSCPDWSNPCKHIAAVYYLLGEEFDRDPFLIFKLRGISGRELTELLLGAPGEKESGDEEGLQMSMPAEPLTADPSRFWDWNGLPDEFLGQVLVPPVPAALAKQLGGFPFWRGKERLLDALEEIYAKASSQGLAVLLGKPGTEEGEQPR